MGGDRAGHFFLVLLAPWEMVQPVVVGNAGSMNLSRKVNSRTLCSDTALQLEAAKTAVGGDERHSCHLCKGRQSPRPARKNKKKQSVCRGARDQAKKEELLIDGENECRVPYSSLIASHATVLICAPRCLLP